MNSIEARPAFFRAGDHQLIQEAYPFSVQPEDSYDDVHDMLELGAAVPGPDESLESIYPSADACPL